MWQPLPSTSPQFKTLQSAQSAMSGFPPPFFVFIIAARDGHFIPQAEQQDLAFSLSVCLLCLTLPHLPTPPLCNHPAVRHRVVTSMLYHSTWLYSERTWQLRAALCLRRSLSLSPSLQLASVFLSEWGLVVVVGRVVKCIIYPCLPPESGTHKRAGLLPECSRQRCLEGLARSQDLFFFLFCFVSLFSKKTKKAPDTRGHF